MKKTIKKITKKVSGTKMEIPLSVVDSTTHVLEEKVFIINPIELDLGRADLNAIVGKLNEVINHINK